MHRDKIRFFFIFILLAVSFILYFRVDLSIKKSSRFILLDTLSNNDENNQIKTSQSINACIFILVRNEDLPTLANTIRLFEKQFNHKYNYPYLLVNDEQFTDEFKETILKTTKSKVEFGLIPKEHWSLPSWINETKMYHLFETELSRVPRANILSYHHMCRYYSGFFFRHELALKYDYYWRLDHHVDFPCEINENPFERLVKENKHYGFVMAGEEIMETIPTLWSKINKWLNESGYKNEIPPDNLKRFVTKDDKTLNGCHFWNNFEIGSFKLFRNEIYLSYFDYLDKAGGFYYERWGDAPVHTYFLSLMLHKHQIVRFENIGYGHGSFYTFPDNKSINCYLNSSSLETNYGSECKKLLHLVQNNTIN